ncbi:MAG: MoaD/ThiS family protein [Desulfovibrio sp.]|nr:MoaD/ThiS family protein [Desulfovibrio sp.]
MSGQPAIPEPADPAASPASASPVVTVRCLASLAKYRPRTAAVPLTGAAPRVAGLMAALNLPPEAVTTILVNAAPASPDTPLDHGDAVTFLPTLTGG